MCRVNSFCLLSIS